MLGGVRPSIARVAEEARFELAWRTGFARSGGRVDARPAGAGAWGGPFLTTVIWVPADVALAVRAATAPLRERWPEHFHYPADRLHVTVADLSRFLLPSGEAGLALDRLADAVGASGPIDVALRGLGVSPSTLFAQAFVSGRLAPLRARLGKPAPGLVGALRAPLDGAAFANVARLRQPASPALIRELARQRRRPLGAFTATEVELLRTDKVGTPSATTSLARWSLDRQRPREPSAEL